MRIVMADDGSKPDWVRMLLRYVGLLIGIVIFFLGVIWAGFDRRKQGWHDKMAGTVVVARPEYRAIRVRTDGPGGRRDDRATDPLTRQPSLQGEAAEIGGIAQGAYRMRVRPGVARRPNVLARATGLATTALVGAALLVTSSAAPVSGWNQASAEATLWQLLNGARANNGLNVLVQHGTLVSLARWRSAT